MKIAIVGGGVSGLVAAHRLQRRHELTLFEAGAHAGGHAHTVDVRAGGRELAVDLGFVVYNETTYPEFTRLLRRLEIATQPTEMSFSVRCERSGLEYCGNSLDTFFAQRRNLLRPAFWGMVRDILRFNREAKHGIEEHCDGTTLGEYLASRGHRRMFIDNYILPMGSAIWSASPERLLDFPAAFFLRFFDNHGLLTVNRHHSWRTIVGGSRRYVEALIRPIGDRVRLRTPVRSVRRRAEGVTVAAQGGPPERFDQVVIATHADQALRILDDPSDLEREILGAFPYQRNEALLHTDEAMLPRNRRARASWNYHVPERQAERVVVTYDMSRLQRLDTSVPLCLTLNRSDVDPGKVLLRREFAHPLFTGASIRAQARHAEISGVRRTHYSGAYWGNGFHEDGVVSALAACRRLESQAEAA